METQKQVPQSWVDSGTEILLARVGAANSELVTLQGVSDFGIAYAYLSDEMQETIFIPWSVVAWMRPSVEADLQESEGDLT